MTVPQKLQLTLPQLSMPVLAWAPDGERLALCVNGFPGTSCATSISDGDLRGRGNVGDHRA